MVETVKDVLLARQMWTYMHPRMKLETVAVNEDDSGVIHLASNPMGSARSKHINIRHHFIRDVVKKGNVNIVHVETKLQHADSPPENLNGNACRKHRTYVMNSTSI